MKKSLNLILGAVMLLTIVSCEKKDEPKNKIAIIGAQENTTTGGDYSVAENTVFTQATAFADQTAIDILCFYEAAGGNNIALA